MKGGEISAHALALPPHPIKGLSHQNKSCVNTISALKQSDEFAVTNETFTRLLNNPSIFWSAGLSLGRSSPCRGHPSITGSFFVYLIYLTFNVLCSTTTLLNTAVDVYDQLWLSPSNSETSQKTEAISGTVCPSRQDLTEFQGIVSKLFSCALAINVLWCMKTLQDTVCSECVSLHVTSNLDWLNCLYSDYASSPTDSNNLTCMFCCVYVHVFRSLPMEPVQLSLTFLPLRPAFM